MFLFAFSAFSRIGEIMCSDGISDDIIQLSNVSFTRGAGKLNQVNVCLRKFKPYRNASSSVFWMIHAIKVTVLR